MFLFIASFLAGILTSLAPCILPLLPVIIGSSILPGSDKKKDRSKPFIIAGSLALSVILFTLLLKVSSLLIGVKPEVWLVASGGIVVLIGLNMLYPQAWLYMSAYFGFEQSSNKFLSKAYSRKGWAGSALTGAALGPVFSSCSPVYALILATILPVNLGLGILYIISYALGLAVALLAISLLGRRLTTRLAWATNPSGAFTKVLAIILILVGMLVLTGYDNRFQVWSADHLPTGLANLEKKLLPADMQNKQLTASQTANLQASSRGKAVFNIKPYAAPEFTGIQDWINGSPETLASLKGKVVLIDFWTYSCINCQRTQPYLNTWYDKYEKDGFVIIGVHAPEFAFEKIPANVRTAVKNENIKYPVALDNNLATWNAYQNQYWPAKYLIDKDGQVRYTQFGEGEYQTTEAAIQTLLKESGHTVNQALDTSKGAVAQQAGQTPETYLNYSRGERFSNASEFMPDKTINYTVAGNPDSDNWSLGGSWQVGNSQTVAKADGSVLRLKFTAKEVYLVMNGPAGKPVTLMLNGQPVTASQNGGEDVDASGNVHLDGPRLYKLVNLPSFSKNQTLDITVPGNTTINAFTFGG